MAGMNKVNWRDVTDGSRYGHKQSRNLVSYPLAARTMLGWQDILLSAVEKLGPPSVVGVLDCNMEVTNSQFISYFTTDVAAEF